MVVRQWGTKVVTTLRVVRQSAGAASGAALEPDPLDRVLPQSSDPQRKTRFAVAFSASFGLKSKQAEAKAAADAVAAAAAAGPPADGPPAPRARTRVTACRSMHVHLSVELKAFVPELTPRSAVVAARLADRFVTYDKFKSFWARRPAMPVSSDPSAWWKHASHCVTTECRCDGAGHIRDSDAVIAAATYEHR
eukprot:97459-Chlamydomonas_euryale.AAC.6